jgi:hypothetical protein
VIDSGCFEVDVNGRSGRLGCKSSGAAPAATGNEKSFTDQLKHGITLEFFLCTHLR